MKPYSGRRVRIYKYMKHGLNQTPKLTPTPTTGYLLEIDVHNEHVMVEDEAGNIVKLFYKLVKFI